MLFELALHMKSEVYPNTLRLAKMSSFSKTKTQNFYQSLWQSTEEAISLNKKYKPFHLNLLLFKKSFFFPSFH